MGECEALIKKCLEWPQFRMMRERCNAVHFFIFFLLFVNLFIPSPTRRNTVYYQGVSLKGKRCHIRKLEVANPNFKPNASF